RYATTLIVVAAAVSGEVLSELLKLWFARPRPAVVPHLRAVATGSFPSGHAMQSAIVYLTLGVLLTRVVAGSMTKIYCLVTAIIVTLLVGVSRVVLGVHYPTDVFGGWLLGFLWASIIFLVARRFEPTVVREREHAE
ncbi:MAG: phosphatase PAP2 family protein, partial [Vicinamibacterales bacterium]